MSISWNFILGLIVLVSCQGVLAGTCGQNFTAPEGSIQSPGFPVQYDNNLDCDWFISPNKTSVFYIRSLSFNTEVCCDKVTVSVIRANSSSAVENQLVISGNNVLSLSFLIEKGDVVQVHFHTDVSIVNSGFRLLYTTNALCPESSGYFQCNDGFLCLRSAFTCDGINDCIDGSDEWGPICAEHGTCGGNLTSDEGNLTSPGWPVQYGRGLSCDWFLSSNVTSMVFLKSLAFNTGVNAELTVSVISADTSSEEAMSVTHLNDAVRDIFPIERGDVLHIHFTTDNSTTSQGFQLYYNAKDECQDVSKYYQCPDGTCMPASLKCDAVADCLDGSDEFASTCVDGCSNESLYHCANGQCVVNHPCDGIADCNDGSDESQGCLVAEDISEGDTLQASVSYQQYQQKIRVALCSDDSCEALLLIGLSPDRQSVAYESYSRCSFVSCDDDSLVNFNYPSGWTAFAAGSWQFFVSIRDGDLSVGWNNASRVDAILPITSASRKRLLIYPLAQTTWIHQPSEGPQSSTTEPSTDPAYSTFVTSEVPNPTEIISSSTSASSTLAPAPTSATSLPAAVTTTMTAAASTSTPTSTPPTTTFPTTPAPTYTSTDRSTIITTLQPVATTTRLPSTAGWTTITTANGTSRPTDGPTVISTSTTPAPSTPSSTIPDTTSTWTPDYPTSPTPAPSTSWPPVPAPPVCPTDFPLRYRYLLIPVDGHRQLYVICFAGWGQSMKCPKPLAFSYSQQICSWPWNVTIPDGEITRNTSTSEIISK